MELNWGTDTLKELLRPSSAGCSAVLNNSLGEGVLRRSKSLSWVEVQKPHLKQRLARFSNISFVDKDKDFQLSDSMKFSLSEDSNQSISSSKSVVVKKSDSQSSQTKVYKNLYSSPLNRTTYSTLQTPVVDDSFRSGLEDDLILTRSHDFRANSHNVQLTFLELNTGLRTLDGSLNEENWSQTKHNQCSSDNNQSHQSNLDIDKSEYNWRKLVIMCFVLGIIIFLLLAIFIPVIVVLANGTRNAVIKYFDRNEGELSKLYLDRFGNKQSIKTNSSFESNLVAQFHDASSWYEDDELNQIRNLTSIGQKLYGVAYSPILSMEPDCGVTPRDVELDLVKLSAITSRIRTYGVQCNQAELVLKAIVNLNLEMTVSLGIWIGNNKTINRDQINTAIHLFEKYPQYLFDSVLVGNEVLFRQDQSEDELILYIKTVRWYLQTLGYSNIPVGTAELGSLISSNLMSSCDIIGANIHPFFGGGKVEYASNWVFDFLKYQLSPINHYKIPIIITEVGWPFQGGRFLSSVASSKNFEYFMNDFVCKAAGTDYGYYYFEAYNEPWKSIYHEPNKRWETEWGIFNSDRSNKIDLSCIGIC